MTVETTTPPEPKSDAIEQGAYELLRDRLLAHGKLLKQKVDALNQRRSELFGGQELAVIGNERIITENSCQPADVVGVGKHLMFGYNVQLGMRATAVSDLLSLHEFHQQDSSFEFRAVAREAEDNFLNDAGFLREFGELVRYYKDPRILQFRLSSGRLFMAFAAGPDWKILRWEYDGKTRPRFLDTRGEQEFRLPPSHDFEWIETSRENHVQGLHPHVNIRDKVFVETVGGDLTIKIENNTEDGLGIYSEPVDEPKQALHDARILYSDQDPLMLLKILPYREKEWRHLVFNTRDKSVRKIAPIGQSCVKLPESHGIIFPGGYYLNEGTQKSFDGDFSGLVFEKSIRSPNGEDVLYIFRHPTEGRVALLSYNMVSRECQPPIHCHGYSLFEDGRMVVFRSVSDAPSKVHPMQIWQTPYCSPEHHLAVPKTGSYLEKIGNADLVKGISDCLSICRRIHEQKPSIPTYEDLIGSVNRAADFYHWLDHEEVGKILGTVVEIRKTSELVMHEFDKVETLRHQATRATEEATANLETLVRKLHPEDWTGLDSYIQALDKLRNQRGHVITLREMRYIDLGQLDKLEKKLIDEFDRISHATVEFLDAETAFAPFQQKIEQIGVQLEAVEKSRDAQPLQETLEAIGHGLEVLNEVVGALKVDDPTVRTQILERLSEVMAQLNRVRALVQGTRKTLGEKESVAEFAAQFKLFSQNASSAVSLADSPEKCDSILSGLMLQLEELEGKFGEYDRFVTDLVAKREEVYNSFSSKKQVLLDQRQRRVEQMVTAAERILEGIARRASSLGETDDLNTYFASDPMVMKIRDLSERLRGLGDPVKADELLSRLKTARQDASRGLRDRQDLFEEGTAVVRFGRHRFSVNHEPIELTMVPRGGEMHIHITGTDFYQKLADPEFDETRPFWEQQLISENEQVYRSEYLAACVLAEAENPLVRPELTLPKLYEARRLVRADEARPEGKDAPEVNPGLLKLVRDFAADRYDEGYERGVHDVDATLVLEQVLHLYATGGLLRYSPRARKAAILKWVFGTPEAQAREWQHQARSLVLLQKTFGPHPAVDQLAGEISRSVGQFAADNEIELTTEEIRQSGAYLVHELGRPSPRFVTNADAVAVRDGFLRHIQSTSTHAVFQEDLAALSGNLLRQYDLVEAWIGAFVGQLSSRGPGTLEAQRQRARHVQEEAAVLLLTEGKLDREVSSALTHATVRSLLGQHPRIRERSLELRLDEFLTRTGEFRHERVPAYRRYQQARHRLVLQWKERLRLEEFAPKVMSAFVRNKLIDEIYLPLGGANLAKQMGSVGEDKRTDQMGMLLLISPPGYGKTTLMEYIASRLGLVFVKVNGPALGHGITSLDPGAAENATARQEVEKVNFALEMGNNVMLYIDDIQHTHPEFLQKFISLCDAQRRMEGIWNGRTRTYDLRGKRFCIVMAGNPYTEAGAKFQIPDMLANRADTYNLGDVLQGKEDLFELSYLENALTSNPALAPLASREPGDVHRLIQMADGVPVPASDLSHTYSQVELDEILSVLKKLLKVQKVLLRVNRQYILSAGMDDAFRTEPSFKLQGSYRNMNKLAEKVVPVMNDDELERLVDDHYLSESQTLTTGAEHNLLKLAELRDRMSPTQKDRWNEIKKSFARRQVAGGADDDPMVRGLSLLSLLSERLEDIAQTIRTASHEPSVLESAAPAAVDLTPFLGSLSQVLEKLAERQPQAAAALSSAPVPTAVTLPPEAFSESLDSLVQVVPLLRQVAETIRGPKSKTIVMDARLVKVFDGLREAESLSQVMAALEHLKERKKARTTPANDGG
ncbi:MAG: DNA repair ATPase [Armatimonadetes bacterium]|nr:DNA repair ATPase [Armatimonadota bacterium]